MRLFVLWARTIPDLTGLPSLVKRITGTVCNVANISRNYVGAISGISSELQVIYIGWPTTNSNLGNLRPTLNYRKRGMHRLHALYIVRKNNTQVDTKIMFCISSMNGVYKAPHTSTDLPSILYMFTTFLPTNNRKYRRFVPDMLRRCQTHQRAPFKFR